MQPSTATIPKCLLPVAGRPFADWQLTWLASEGVDHVVFCIGHLGGLVKDYVGDGSDWTLEVSYVDEGSQLRGTAGALLLGAEIGVLDERFFVLYGDSYLSVNLSSVEDRFLSSACAALMTVYRNAGSWEESNAVFDGDMVLQYHKHCSDPPDDMLYVDYGLLAFHRDVLSEIPRSSMPMDLAPVLERLSLGRRLAGYEARERFYEIGSPEGLRSLEEHLGQR